MVPAVHPKNELSVFNKLCAFVFNFGDLYVCFNLVYRLRFLSKLKKLEYSPVHLHGVLHVTDCKGFKVLTAWKAVSG